MLTAKTTDSTVFLSNTSHEPSLLPENSKTGVQLTKLVLRFPSRSLPSALGKRALHAHSVCECLSPKPAGIKPESPLALGVAPGTLPTALANYDANVPKMAFTPDET